MVERSAMAMADVGRLCKIIITQCQHKCSSENLIPHGSVLLLVLSMCVSQSQNWMRGFAKISVCLISNCHESSLCAKLHNCIERSLSDVERHRSALKDTCYNHYVHRITTGKIADNIP